MWFQFIIYIAIIIGFCWLFWKYIITPFLVASGIDVNEEKEVKTDHTKRLEKAKKDHAATTASVNAAKEEEEVLQKNIASMEEEIKDIDRRIEDGNFEDKEEVTPPKSE